MSEPAAPRLPSLAPGGSVITVGSFDGVHRGHQAVIREIRRQAALRRAASVLVTFDPHPLRVVNPPAAPRLLTTPAEKRRILEGMGLDHVVFLPFTPQLAGYPPRRFVKEILYDRLGLAHLVVGHDHALGRGRSGDVAVLREIGDELGFEVDVVPAVLLDAMPISSTRIRRLLEEGDAGTAAAGLGRPYSLQGPVVRGDGRGRALGFPTANIEVTDPEKLIPLEGIYAVRATLRGRRHEGALHLGPRPTFAGAPPSVEVYLFDFDDTIYGEEVGIDFCARIREIRTFGTVAGLVDAIRADVVAARRIFAAGGDACQRCAHPLD